MPKTWSNIGLKLVHTWCKFGAKLVQAWSKLGVWTKFRPRLEQVLGIIRTCVGQHPDMFWASSRHALGIIQTCFGYHPDMFRASSRHVWHVFFQVCTLFFFFKISNVILFHNFMFFEKIKKT